MRRTTALTLVVGAGIAAGTFVVTSRTVDGHEIQLLSQQSAAAASMLASSVQQEHDALARAARSLNDFGGGVATAIPPGLAGIALLREQGLGLHVVARSGSLAAEVPPDGRDFRPPWLAGIGDGLSFTGFTGSGTTRALGVALGFPDGEVLYSELPLAPLDAGLATAPSATNSPFDHLDFALYLGTGETASSLIAATTDRLPLNGHRATVMLSGTAVASPPVVDAAPGSIHDAPGQLFMVLSPRGNLGGTLDAILPEAVLIGTLVVTLLVAGFVEMAARRRDEAVALAAALRDSERNFRQLFAANPQVMWAYDMETLRFLDVNDAAVHKYGYSRDEFLAMRITDIRPDEDRVRLVESVRTRGDRSLEDSGPWRHELRDGRLIEVTITSHVQDFGGRRAALVSIRDVTVERALEERLRHQALHDPLTGAGNRELLTTHLIAMLDDPAETSCALLLVDVAGMRAVNANLGRDGADALLVSVGERLTAAAGTTAHVARLGGDVFALAAAHGRGDHTAARAWADRMVAALDMPFTVYEQAVPVNLRAGLAVAEPGIDERELLRRADTALAAAKELPLVTGRHVEVFDAERDRARAERRTLERELREAVGSDQLRLHYQPLLDLERGRITGVEALIRWQHPQRGLLAPAAFLGVAEACGLMTDIDAWVIAEACRQARLWLDAGFPELAISVNICGHDVATGRALVELVRSELQRNRLPAHVLEIELTESVALRDPEEAESVLGELRALGVTVALDDFGTGYSMLDRVRDLPMDRVKIDRTFVRRAGGEGASLLQAMITMAHSLGLRAVAEGVETTAQLDLLRRWGCDAVQGFLISRPVPAERIASMLDGSVALLGVRRRPSRAATADGAPQPAR